MQGPCEKNKHRVLKYNILKIKAYFMLVCMLLLMYNGTCVNHCYY